ncbi:MAG: RNA polymerase sigma factor [Acidobacteria bacterium]|nr:RNA polymerase sigma factor [Acidobacteriota bacterium]
MLTARLLDLDMTTTRRAASQTDFGQLVDIHQAEILRYLRRLTGDRTTADDLFQETFLRAFRAFARLGTQPNHRAWLYRIATNQFLNHRRSRGLSVEVALVADTASRGVSPVAAHEREVVSLRLRQAIARLPKRQRVAFVQRQLHGFSYRDVSTVLACSETAARANVYQAMRRLRRELAGWGRTT